MTTYQPPAFQGLMPDVEQLNGSIYSSRTEQVQPPLGQPKVMVKMSKDGKSAYWRAEIYDLRGGLNADEVMSFAEGHTRLRSSSLESDFYKHLTLPGYGPTQSTPDVDLTHTPNRISSANIFGHLMIGAGGGTTGLFLEDQSGPTVTQVTYNAGGAAYRVVSLSKALLGANVERLIVGQTTGPAKIVSSITGTVDATMNAALVSLWGAVQVPLPGLPILFYYGAALNGAQIGSLLVTNLDTDAPVVQLTSVPVGGYIVGVESIGGGSIGVYMVWPKPGYFTGAPGWDDNSTLADIKNLRQATLMRLNEYGQQAAEIDMGLRGNLHTVICRKTICATDGESVRTYDGRTRPRDTGIFANRPANAGRKLVCLALAKDGDDLYAKVAEVAINGTSGATITWYERFDFDLWTWTPASAEFIQASTHIYGLMAGAGGLPVSEFSNKMYDYQGGQWYRNQLHPPGVNPFSLRGNGSDALYGYAYTTNGDAFMPGLELPGIEGWPKVMRRMTFGGDVDAGGASSTKAQVNITAGGVTGEFVTGKGLQNQVRKFDGNENVFYQLAPHFEIIRQSGGTTPEVNTPNGLPVIFEGWAYAPKAIAPPKFSKENLA